LGDTSEMPDQIELLVVPIDILKSFHDELDFLTGQKVAAGILYRCGARGGSSVIRKFAPELKKKGATFAFDDRLPVYLKAFWADMGLGDVLASSYTDGELRLTIGRSVEANALGPTGRRVCDYTRGYLAGTVSELLGAKFHSEETSCVSAGDDHCEFQVTEVEA
jgi:predicted hydrocarbon binding protein